MSIKEELKSMTDSGEFEILATSILRRADPLYKSLVHTGINAEGKAITDPVDGFCRVKSSSPPHYVFFAHTTSKTESLKSKWLRDPDQGSGQESGDVIKADTAAERIRNEVPNAEFTVVLTSNKVVESDLLIEAEIEGDKRGLSVEVWGLHELGDFLKNDPDGQWIARQHFGVVERRLSEELLLEISEKDMEAYQEKLRLQNAGPLVKRPELFDLIKVAHGSDSDKYFVPIVGNSGFGKTTICYQAMKKWQNEGKPTLRLTPKEIQNSKSLTQAFQASLQSYQSELNSFAGQDAVQIARSNGPLLIIVDDLNRADSPSILFKRIVNWVGGVRKSDSSDSAAIPVIILCPLWPRVWARQERDVDHSKFVDPIELEEFDLDTASELVCSLAENADININQQKAESLAEKVGRDPHLIGLLGKLIEREGSVENLPKTSRDIIDEYVHQSYKIAADFSTKLLVADDCNIAIEHLSLCMLREGDLEPTWRSVRDWTSSTSDNREALRSLTKQAQLLVLFQRLRREILSFRHDRMRDYLLAYHGLEAVSCDTEATEFIDNPYYYSIFGKGIAYFRPSDDVLMQLCQENPLSLLEALRELGGESSEYENKIISMFRTWLEDQGGPNQLSPSVLGEATSVLYETDNRQIIDIARAFPNTPQALLARFRNGDIGAGILFCGVFSSPDVNDSQRDSVMKQVRSQRKKAYAEALSDVFDNLDEEHISGALRLAGFLRSSTLAPDIEKAWKEFGKDDSLLVDFIWAAFRCGIPGHESLVDEALDQWSSLPRDDDEGISRFGHAYSELKFALTKDVSDEQVEYLIKAVDEFPDIEHQLLLFLRKIPDPDALECVARKTGQNISESDDRPPGGYMSQFTEEWNPSLHRGQPLPPEGKSRLKKIWSDEGNSDEVRYSAFQFWAVCADTEDIEDLQQASDMKYSEYFANITRLRLGDKSLIRSPTFDPLENSKYLRVLANVWCEETHKIVNKIFDQEFPTQNTNLPYDLAELLVQLDKDTAEELLSTHWESIGDHQKFFQAALYTSTPLTRELAREVYLDSDDPGYLLMHVGQLFGFNVRGKSELLSEKHLRSLEPYLSEIEDMTLTEIGKKAKEIGMSSWSVKNVQPHLSEDARPRVHPTDDDLLEELDEIEESDDTMRMSAWMDRFDRRLEPTTRAFEIIEKWLKKNPTVKRYRIAARAIRDRGTREELSILDEVSPEGDKTEKFYDDAKFGVQVRSLS